MTTMTKLTEKQRAILVALAGIHPVDGATLNVGPHWQRSLETLLTAGLIARVQPGPQYSDRGWQKNQLGYCLTPAGSQALSE